MRAANPRRAALAGLCLVTLALGGCAPQGAESTEVEGVAGASNPELATYPDVPVVADIEYGAADGQPLLLDACLPPDFDALTDPARAAIVVVHGGSWARGSKDDVAWRAVCQWLAASGYPAFALDYRLAPEHPYPAAIDDVGAAVEWLRDPEQLARFGIDPDRIGAFGGSAGGNLVSLLGTRGTGSLDVGSRVAAVVELSGPIDLTGVAVTDDFVPVQLAYLGCATEDACPAAVAASADTWVDASDPPFFVAHSTDEMIPLGQAKLFVRALRDAGVDTTFVTVTGTLHSIAMLDAGLKQRILDFYARTLAPKELPVAPATDAADAAPPAG
ncbi:alpha/beta hydrolase [Protaetiibacter intestinalis]|uniref:Alpha/beta hydrolase n=1 Tax=Protaetiibacter intestinalis TaxID=2419774 RepID=A0A387B5V6_9MICO|nr:alpha/beta hydrolase [Protaetiibacter intestinalis]AYF97697.1 alpha/beta hydrolase [Protaetiibacter intestinalis]